MAGHDLALVLKALARLDNEHKLILTYRGRFADMLAENDLTRVHDKLQALATPLAREIKDHFRFEEDYIFPAALAATSFPEITKLVLSLQKEHGIIERELGEIFELATGTGDCTPSVAGEIVRRANRLMPIICDHCARESSDLAALFRTNNEVMVYLTRLLQEDGILTS